VQLLLCPGPYFHGPPGQQIFRGGILKKSRFKYGMREKKGCPRERNLREIYTENNVGTEFLVTTLLALEGAEAIAY